jgi:hypothetical protein
MKVRGQLHGPAVLRQGKEALVYIRVCVCVCVERKGERQVVQIE